MDARKVLIVCTGNTCRSCMAEAMLTRMLRAQGLADKVEVISAGLSAVEGTGASQGAIKVMNEWDIDLKNHGARRLTPEMLEYADIVLTMTTAHKNMIMTLNHTEGKNNVFTLREFASDGEAADFDILDPFGGDVDVYRECAHEIRAVLESALPKIIRYLDLT